MARPILYFGQIMKAGARRRARSRQRKYIVYHELVEAGGWAHIAPGLTEDQLAGYLEGACAGKYDALGLINGFSEKILAECFPDDVIRPLSPHTLESVLEKAALSDRYTIKTLPRRSNP